MPGIEEKNETGDEDLEDETPESEKSEEDDSDTGSGSDGDESSGAFIRRSSFIAQIAAESTRLPTALA